MAEENAFDIPGFTAAFHISRARVFTEIKANRLETFKVGRRRLISKQAAEEWMRTLESDERTRRAKNPDA